MSIRNEFFNKLNQGAKWDIGVSINRTNPLPLDANSVFKSYEDLEAYCNGVLAYVGQPVAVVEEDETTLYVLDGNKSPQKVGTATMGDDKSIELTSDGVLRIIGSDTAPEGSRLVMTATGVAWEVPDTETVDGLAENVTSLRNTVYGIEASGNEEDENYIPAVPGLTSRMASAETDIAHLKEQASIAFRFKGTCTTEELANKTDQEQGDIWFVGDIEYAWNGSSWVELGYNTDLSQYSTTDQMGVAISNAKTSALVEAGEDATKKANKALSDANKYTDILKESVEDNTEEISKLKTKDTEILESLGTKASSDEVNQIKTSLETEIGKKANTSDVNERLNEKVDKATYSTDKSNIDSSIETLTNAKTSHEGTLAQHTQDISGIQTELLNKASNEIVNGLASRMGTAEGNISSLQGTVSSLQATKADSSTVTELSNKVNGIVETNTTQEAQISSLEESVSNLNTANQNLNSAVSEAQTKANDAYELAESKLSQEDINRQNFATQTQAQSYADAKDTAIQTAQSTANEALTGIGNLEQYITEFESETNDSIKTMNQQIGIMATQAALTAETNRAKKAESDNATNISSEIDRATEKENELNSKIDSEISRATSAENNIIKRLETMEVFWDTTEDTDGIVNKLKEIQEYIASDTTGATNLINRITEVAQNLADEIARAESEEQKLSAADATNLAAAKKYADDAISALKIGDYAKAAELTVIANQITNHISDTVKHITEAERTSWNNAELNAKNYADSLAKN